MYVCIYRDRAGESVKDVQRVHAVQSQYPAGRRRIRAGAVDLQEPGYSSRRTAGWYSSMLLNKRLITNVILLLVRGFIRTGKALDQRSRWSYPSTQRALKTRPPLQT